MKKNDVVQTALLNYVSEISRIKQALLVVQESLKKENGSRPLLENKYEFEIKKALFEGFLDRLKKFVGPKSQEDEDRKIADSIYKQEMQQLDKLKSKIQKAVKEVGNLAKVSLEDPTRVGMSLDSMVELLADVKKDSDDFMKMYEESDSFAQQRLEELIPELQDAKVSLYGMVGFRLVEIMKEIEETLNKLTSMIPTQELKAAISKGKQNFVPTVTMRSAFDRLSGADLPATQSSLEPGSFGGLRGSK